MIFNRALTAQPKAFWVLAFGELWSTFSYFGTQTVLVLYCLHVFSLASSQAYLLFGAYSAFAYSLPLLGGMVADKWLGSKNAVILGGSLNCLGNLILTIPHYYFFCLGLAVSLIGYGIYKSSSTHLVGALYHEDSSQKEQAFTLIYLAVNVGGVLGPLIYGLVIYAVGWSYGFRCSAIVILISVLLFIRNQDLYFDERRLLSYATKASLCGILPLTCLLLSLPLYFINSLNAVIVLLFIGIVVFLARAISKYQGFERRKLLVLLAICFFGMFYFVAGLQIGTTVTVFIQSKMHDASFNTKIPASIFSTFYPLFVLLLAPLFNLLWRALAKKGIMASHTFKIVLSLIFATLGMGAFTFSAVTTFTLSGIIAGYIFLGAGELVLTPTIYTMISNTAPSGMKSTMMGVWLLLIAFGGYLSAIVAKRAKTVSTYIVLNQNTQATQFISIAAIPFLVLLIFICIKNHVDKMLVSNQ